MSNQVFGHEIDAKRGLRELRILRSVSHENILRVRDIMTMSQDDVDVMDAVYLVVELMETDLHRVIYSQQELTELHYKFFMYQLAKALYYLHSADVVHRDLKPANCLLNSDSTLKLADFGLAKSDVRAHLNPDMTAYVVTRWYRAPEIILDRTRYGHAVDMWAAGTIFAEMLNRQPLFPGQDERNEIVVIMTKLGRPTAAQIERITNPIAKDFLRRVPLDPPPAFESLFPLGTHVEALDLLARLLAFDPEERLTAAQMLEHPYFADVRDPPSEVIAAERVDMGIEYHTVELTTAQIRRLVYNEMLHFHPELGLFDSDIMRDYDAASSLDEDASWMDF